MTRALPAAGVTLLAVLFAACAPGPDAPPDFDLPARIDAEVAADPRPRAPSS